MARTWLSIRVDLVDGMHAHALWPRPGRLMLARPGMTFRMLADAINDAFARWDLAHLHAFTLADGTRITMKGPWDDDWNEPELDDTQEKLTRLSLGEQFTYEFDFGDSWMHLCTVADEKVDPHEVYGEAPKRPVASPPRRRPRPPGRPGRRAARPPHRLGAA
ncbi:MAG: plasmid pRiA4b ORF-3 family protein [Actinobacteria bacterium]|nr:plasmid pRiA4b ORF-3 family protein [Actinomycetota bacterium]